jgi:serralysin
VHELGHALGLGHAGPYNGFVDTQEQQFSAYDTLAWSVMSYIEPHQSAKYEDEYPVHTDWGLSPEGYTLVPTTMMALDILAIQGLYGAPLSTPLNGGQTFGFNCDVGGTLQPFFDFTVNKNPVITIWSAGTGNTLDLSGYRADSDVNLNGGMFSSVDGRKNNICIAFGTVIETAIGGKGNDKFTGNDFANTLIGGLGNDDIRGGLGSDAMTGGRGNDIYKYGAVAESTGAGFDTITGFDFGAADVFDFNGTVEAVDAAVQFGTLSEASFEADLEAAIGTGVLGGHHAVLFRPDEGDLHGRVFIVVDANNEAGYQAGEDFVVFLESVKHRGEIDVSDFV